MFYIQVLLRARSLFRAGAGNHPRSANDFRAILSTVARHLGAAVTETSIKANFSPHVVDSRSLLPTQLDAVVVAILEVLIVVRACI